MEEKYFLTHCVPCPKSGYVKITQVDQRIYKFECSNTSCDVQQKVNGVIIDFVEVELFEKNHLGWGFKEVNTKNKMIEFVEKIYADCVEIMKRKNADYGADGDPLKNFRMVENAGLCSVETGIVVRMSDKFQRVINLMDKEPSVKDESVKDTLMDLINYAAILLFALSEKK